jgi:class 3 adenylate cyclase
MDAQIAKRPSTPESPGGEVCYIYVVFADLADFTSFAKDHPPDEVGRTVGDLLQCLGQVVEEQGGMIDSVLGDAVVAIFGRPDPDPSAVRNAVRAGRAMQAKTLHFNRERVSSFALCMGVHAGKAMFRGMGGSMTVMGDTVNTASQIQSAAASGKVWISRAVYEEVRLFLSWRCSPRLSWRVRSRPSSPVKWSKNGTVLWLTCRGVVGRESDETIINKLQSGVLEQFTPVDSGRTTLAVDFFAFFTGGLRKGFHIAEQLE